MNRVEAKGSRKWLAGIVLACLAIICASALLFKVLTNQLVNKTTETITLQYSQEMNAQMTAHISGTLRSFQQELNVYHKALLLIDDLNEEKLSGFISGIKQENGVEFLGFVDDNGYIYDGEKSYLGTLSIDMLGQLLNGEKNIVSDSDTVDEKNYILFGTSYQNPIQMGEKHIVAGIYGISNDRLADEIILNSDYSGGYSSIIHADGSYIVKNPSEPFGGLNVFSILEKNTDISAETFSALKKSVSENGSYLINVAGNGLNQSYYVYFAPIEGTDWYSLSALPGNFIRSSVEDLQNGLALSYALVIAALVIAGAVIIYTLAVTSQKLAGSKKELESALKKAEDASNAKTNFLFNMSHDIRTPMNAILGFTDIAIRYIDSDISKSKESLGKIKMSSSHLLNLINDILEMSRIESGKMEIVEKPLDLVQTVRDIESMSQTMAISKSLQFDVNIDEIANPYIYADELHLNQVLINVISNAIKYTHSGGKVCCSVSQITEAVDGRARYRFIVSDTGIGMSEEFQKHIFEAFSREQNAAVSKQEGVGLGLSIVKKIIDVSGGTIKVKSKQGEGSTFIIELPYSVMDEEAIENFKKENQAVTEIHKEISLEGKRVLIVEDNEINCEIAKEFLNDAGFITEEAFDGQMAVDLFRKNGAGYYDFILMDIQMPVMNGYQATAAIRKTPGGEKVPIVALSANAFEEDKRKAIESGMNGHVAKPLNINELLETMRNLFETLSND